VARQLGLMFSLEEVRRYGVESHEETCDQPWDEKGRRYAAGTRRDFWDREVLSYGSNDEWWGSRMLFDTYVRTKLTINQRNKLEFAHQTSCENR
jgi:hypothetical protein